MVSTQSSQDLQETSATREPTSYKLQKLTIDDTKRCGLGKTSTPIAANESSMSSSSPSLLAAIEDVPTPDVPPGTASATSDDCEERAQPGSARKKTQVTESEKNTSYKLQKLTIDDAARSVSPLRGRMQVDMVSPLLEALSSSPAQVAAAEELPSSDAPPGSSAVASDDSEEVVRGLMCQGRMLMGRGKHAQASEVFCSVLRLCPSLPDALVLRGSCLRELGQAEQAQACFREVLANQPDNSAALFQIGQMYLQKGLYEKAVQELRAALDSEPEESGVREALALALTEIGTRLKACGDTQGSVQFYREALEAAPQYAPVHYNMGLVEMEAGAHSAAMLHFQRAAALCPSYAEPHCNQGVLHKLRGDNRMAVESYERSLAISPNFEIAKRNLAIALTHLALEVKNEGNREEATRLLERALWHHPSHAEALYYLGVMLGEQGDLHKAAFHFHLATLFCPECAEAHNYLGVIQKELGNFERALQYFQAAVKVNPSLYQALNNMGVLYTLQGKVSEGLSALRSAAQAAPQQPEPHNDLGVLLRDLGDTQGALQAYEACLRLCPTSRSASQNRLLALNYIKPGESAEVCSAHAQWGVDFQRLVTPLPPLTRSQLRLEPDRKLRIGYISPDFYTHSVSYFAEAPITFHSSSRVDVIYYCCVPYPDARTNTLKEKALAAGARWEEVSKSTEEDVAARVREDRVDILVELTGHTAHNRLGVLAHRPAPIQVTWIGYPNSTGLQCCDYRFVDWNTDPATTTQTHTEELVRLPGETFLCYTPPRPTTNTVPVTPDSSLPVDPPSSASTSFSSSSSSSAATLTSSVSHSAPATDINDKKDDIETNGSEDPIPSRDSVNSSETTPSPENAALPESSTSGNGDNLIESSSAAPSATSMSSTATTSSLPHSTTTTSSGPPVGPLPALEAAGVVTFGSFNALAKMTPEVLALWARLLHEVPNSRLLIKAKPFACNLMQQHFLQILQSEGIPAWRVDLSPLAAATGDHLQRYQLMDISLDPFPYAGTTTTCESLYMGVPCITMRGNCHAHNVGVSLLTSLGLQDWIATNHEQYISIAKQKASDLVALAELRAGLRERMLKSRLCDAPKFVRELEDVYQNLWRRFCEKQQMLQENGVAHHTCDDDSDCPDTRKEEGVPDDCSASRLCDAATRPADSSSDSVKTT